MIITGAGSGIGAATARAVSDRYRLILAGRRLEPLEELAASLGGPANAIAVRCDVTEWDQVEALAGAAIEAFDGIDAVFANAVFAYDSDVEPEMVFAIVLLNPQMERCHWNSRDLFLDPLLDDPPFGQWKGRQDLINVFFFQCKQLRQSLDLVLGQVESC